MCGLLALPTVRHDDPAVAVRTHTKGEEWASGKPKFRDVMFTVEQWAVVVGLVEHAARSAGGRT